MPDFGIFRGFNDKLFGDKLYAGQLPINLGLIGSTDFSGTDPDALAFFARVTAAGGTLSATEQLAIDTLVKQLKLDGIWSKMKAIYPMVGASAAACAQNLKSSSFTGAFNGSFTFTNLGGVTPAGPNAFMATGFISNNEVGLNSVHYSNYFNNFQSNDGAAMGADNDANNGFLTVAWNNSGILFNRFHVSISSIAVNNTSSGFKILSRTGATTTTAYHNGVSIGTSAVPSSARPQIQTYLFARNSSGNPSLPSISAQQFCSIGDGLDSPEASLFNAAVQSFQTTLGRA
jgi:hypothetical protein